VTGVQTCALPISIRWLVERTIPEGVVVVASRPKLGKSWLVFQAAIAIASGGEFLGERVEESDVLYYALEDGPRRLKLRKDKLLDGDSQPANLEIQLEAPRMTEGLEDEINDWLDDHDGGLVVIDVLAKVRPDGRVGLNAYDEDYKTLGGLMAVFHKHPGSCCLLVTHDRKAGSDDWLSMITGTHGVAGSADAALWIERRREEFTGAIHLTGRDIEEERAIGVRFDDGTWSLSDHVVGATTEMNDLVAYVRQNGPVFPSEYAESVGKTRESQARLFQRAERNGLLDRGPRGYVVASPLDTQDEFHARGHGYSVTDDE
jgi:hypothetical protein